MCRVCFVEEGDDRPVPATRVAVGEAELASGRAFLARHPTVDIHAHPGRFFMAGARRNDFTDHYAPPFPQAAIADLRASGATASSFATVADNAVLGFGARSLAATRGFSPGEAYSDHLRQLDAFDAVRFRSALPLARDAAAIGRAHAAGEVVALLSIEGGDFIEDRLDRIDEAADRGVSAITVIHYRTNQIGDTQTEQPVHDGLTPLGGEIVRAMEAARILVDVAHASFAATAAIAEVASRPLLLSHSNVAPPGADHPRLVTLDHARLVTSGGGVVGAVPAGFAQDCFEDYLDTILRMIDQLGIDHIAIGTDLDFTFRPVLASYLDWPALAGGLLRRGLLDADCAKVMGGNFLRIFSEGCAA